MNRNSVRDNVVIIGAAAIGSGHLEAASALARAIEHRDRNTRVVIVDVCELLPLRLGRLVDWVWRRCSTSAIIRPFYATAYNLLLSSSFGCSVVHQVWRALARPIAGVSSFGHISYFVAMHSSAVGIGAQYKEQYGCRLAVVATDFVLHGLHCHPQVDRYFAADHSCYLSREANSVRRSNRISLAGIPIRQFKRKARPHKGLTHALVTFGGSALRGSENLQLIEEVITRCGRNVQFTIVTGGDTRFFSAALSMKRRLSTRGHRITVRGYVSNMPVLLQRADVLIGKAGGLTISEAFASGVPVVAIDTLPGQEHHNAEVLQKFGAGIFTDSAAAIAEFLLGDGVGSIAGASQAARRLGRPTAAREIAEEIVAHLPASA